MSQAWACLGLLHHQADEPWPSSTRRQALVDLLSGVEDWATDAAMCRILPGKPSGAKKRSTSPPNENYPHTVIFSRAFRNDFR